MKHWTDNVIPFMRCCDKHLNSIYYFFSCPNCSSPSCPGLSTAGNPERGSCQRPTLQLHLPPITITSSPRLIPCNFNRSQIDQTSQQLLCSTTKWPVRGGHHGRAPPCDWRLYFLFLAGVRTSSRQGGRGSQRHQRPCAATEDQTSLNLVPYTTMVQPGLACYSKDKRIWQENIQFIVSFWDSHSFYKKCGLHCGSMVTSVIWQYK